MIDKKVYTERIREIFTPLNYQLLQKKENLIPLLQIYLELGLDKNITSLLLSGDFYLTSNTLIFLKSKNLIKNYKEIIDRISTNNMVIKKILES